MGVDRRDGGLDQEDVGAANRLGVAAVEIAVRERLELDPAELRAQRGRDRLCELRVRRPEKSRSRFLGVTSTSGKLPQAPGDDLATAASQAERQEPPAARRSTTR